MKFKDFLNEASKTTVQPKNLSELKKIVEDTIKEKGPKCDLNFIDTSKIRSMYCLFEDSDFNGDISKWNVSNVRNMEGMFEFSRFNKDISKWDVSRVKKMRGMFNHSSLEGNEPDWYSVNESDISRSLDEDDIKDSILKRMKKMFYDVKTDIRVIDMDSYFSVRFTVYDDYEAKSYGGIASWKKWLREDLDIDPKSVEGSKTRHLGSAGGFDYAMRIKK